MNPFFQVSRLTSERTWSQERRELTVRQKLEIESDRAATIIVSQHIDGFDMIEGVRHVLKAGRNELALSEMKIVDAHVSDGVYELSVRICAAGLEPVVAFETINMKNSKGEIEP